MAGAISGSVTWRNVPKGGRKGRPRPRSAHASRVDSRVRTMMITSAMREHRMRGDQRADAHRQLGGACPSGQITASHGLTTSNSVTSAISVAMPMTMPGIITAM
jgi:hypothetical protein